MISELTLRAGEARACLIKKSSAKIPRCICIVRLHRRLLCCGIYQTVDGEHAPERTVRSR